MLTFLEIVSDILLSYFYRAERRRVFRIWNQKSKQKELFTQMRPFIDLKLYNRKRSMRKVLSISRAYYGIFLFYNP